MSHLNAWIAYLIGSGIYHLLNPNSSLSFLDTAFATAGALLVHWLFNRSKA